MLYTLASQIPFIAPDNSNKKLLIIFIIGSVLYVLLHYYLYTSPANDMLEQVKKYIYYVIPVDFGVAYFLMSRNKNKNNEEKKQENPDGYSPEEIKMIEMENVRRMQMAQQMEMQRRQQMAMQNGMHIQQPNQEINKNQIFKPKEQVVSEKEKKEKKSSDKEKTPDAKIENKAEKKVEKKEKQEISDTEIPLYKR